jgi:hypothetical protein
MPVVNTTRTFTNNEQITSTKLNEIMDNSTFVSGAVVNGGGIQVTTGGQLQLKDLEVTSSKLASNSVINAKIADTAVTPDKLSNSDFGDFTVLNGVATIDSGAITAGKIQNSNITQAKLAANVVGNGPVFRARPSVDQNIASGTTTKVIFGTEDFDTNSDFANSRFTPQVAGYYLIQAMLYATSNDLDLFTAYIYKNANIEAQGTRILNDAESTSVSSIVYLNGSSDYVEIFTRHTTNSTRAINAGIYTQFSGCLIRSA